MAKSPYSGYGEAAITVLYANFVGLSQVTSPLANKIDPKVFAKAKPQ